MNKNDQMEEIKKSLSVLSPVSLEIIDDSDRHRGHGEWREDTLTHIRVKISGAIFDGKTRVAQQKIVLAALKPHLDTFLHSVQITIAGCVP